MKNSFISPFFCVFSSLVLVLFSGCIYAQNNSIDKAQTYVSCCLKDFGLSGRIKKIKISTYNFKDGVRESIPINDEIYKFDSKGNCISANSNDYTFSIPTHQMVEYSYDSSGNVLNENYTEDGEFYGRKKYQYNPFKELIYDWENELEEIVSFERKGSYSSRGFNGLLIEIHSDSSGHIFSKTISYYNDGEKKKEEEYSGNTVTHTTNYTYDSNGNLLLSKTSDSSGQVTAKDVYTYTDGFLESTEQYILFSTLDIAKAWRYDTKGREIYYCCYMVLPDYLIESYSYEEDRYGNWNKQWVRNRNNEVVQLIEREIDYY